MMNYKKLCDMEISEIVLGTEGYSERIDRNTTMQLVEFYIENGGNIINTARLYCGGKSEALVGNFIRDKKDKIYVSTKCAHPLVLQNLTHSSLSKEEIEMMCLRLWEHQNFRSLKKH